jgi:hypothetical protein
MSISLLLSFLVRLLDLINNILGLFGPEDALGAEDVLRYPIEVALASSNLEVDLKSDHLGSNK